jgi:nitroimidazol reductase NimA-like FMN-containing flavoprotein (pyridoxamine 5'-phosphate oxidase superfamily)
VRFDATAVGGEVEEVESPYVGVEERWQPGGDVVRERETRNEIRRKDRGKDDAWIGAYLQRATFGFLATIQEGQPFLNSNLFVYDPDRHAIYLHTARTGRTKSNLSEPVPVAFSTAEMGRFLPADEALEFSVEYSGVVVFGTGSVVEDPEEAEAALQMILDRYAPHLEPGRDYRPIVPEELNRTAVFRVDVEAWSGKEKSVDPSFEGAFELPRIPIPFEQPSSTAPEPSD